MRCVVLAFAVLSALVPSRLAAQQAAGWVNGESCWCGYQTGMPRDFVVRGKASTVATKQAAADSIAQWNRFGNVVTLSVDPSSGLGKPGNGIDEVNVLIGNEDALSVYGLAMEPSLLGISLVQPIASFGTFNGCRDFDATGCGPIAEADVLLNGNFPPGWTGDWFAPGFDMASGNPAIVQAIAPHEVGHSLGLHHVFDLPDKPTSFSTMTYANHDVTKFVTRMDANTLRAEYQGLALKGTDVGIFPFTYGNSAEAQDYARLGKDSVLAGETLSLDRWTLENSGTEAASAVEVRFYAWLAGPRRYPEPTDLPLGTAAFAAVPVNTHTKLSGTPLTVPAGTPVGRYWVGAIVTVGGVEDSPWVPGKPNDNRFAVGHNPFQVLRVIAPVPPDGGVSADFSWVPDAPAAGDAVAFSDRTAGVPAGWSWDFGDPASGDANLSTQRNPVHAFSGPGPFTVTLAATGAKNTSTVSRTVTVNGLAPGVPVTRLVPVVLDVGTSPRYTSELTLTNRGTTTATLTLRYAAAPSLGATGSGTVTETLEPGRQLIVPEAMAWLRRKGLAIPASGSEGGSLRVTFTGLSSEGAGWAGARTTTPSGNGRCGLSYPGTDVRQAFDGPVVVFGLREGPSDRSNLAVVNAGESAPITLRVTVLPDSAAAGVPLPDLTLQPGEWYQVDSVLEAGGWAEGRATVERIAGTGPFLAYGVVNDRLTNDGSYVEALLVSGLQSVTGVPVVVESTLFQSELVVASLSGRPSSVLVNYVESVTEPKGDTGWFTFDLEPFEQVIVPDLIDDLRQAGAPIGPRGPVHAGYLTVAFEAREGPVAGMAGARTSTPAAGGGEYGAFYPSSAMSRAARDAWVYGLQQGSGTRSNLAVANVGLEGSDLDVRLQVFDGATGRMASEETLPRLGPGAWFQKSGVLGGVANGYCRLTVASGTDSFLAYGILNDGESPASGTNDGSYVAMEAVAGSGPEPGEVTVTLPGDVPLTMVRVPAGTFLMGSPATERGRDPRETRHAVTLTADYYVGKYAVTQGQWTAIMGTNPSANFRCGADCPVERVAWDEIREAGGFLEKLNAYLSTTRQAGAGKFRLPTEAEWERAARGGTQTRFSFGDALEGDDRCGANAAADPYVWWCANVPGQKTSPVGLKGANPYGLYDVHGNVGEWVEDWYGDYPPGAATDPVGPSTGTWRVSRGGEFGSDLKSCRSAQCDAGRPEDTFAAVGFRLARSR